MLKDKVEGIRKREPELIEQKHGVCCFCGQIATVEEPAGWRQEDIDRLAAEQCDCDGAAEYRGREKRKENAIIAIVEMCGEIEGGVEQEVIDLMTGIVDRILGGEMTGATLDLGDGLKVKITITAKGAIKIERSETKKRSREA